MNKRDGVFKLAVESGMREADLADAEVLDIFERFYLEVEKQLARDRLKQDGIICYGRSY